jgi:putative redox protein
MTLQMYAGRKGWPLDQAIVRLRIQRLPGPRLDTVDREIELVGDLNDEQRARLMEIADRCPVHRTLEAGVDIRSKMLE